MRLCPLEALILSFSPHENFVGKCVSKPNASHVTLISRRSTECGAIFVCDGEYCYCCFNPIRGERLLRYKILSYKDYDECEGVIEADIAQARITDTDAKQLAKGDCPIPFSAIVFGENEYIVVKDNEYKRMDLVEVHVEDKGKNIVVTMCHRYVGSYTMISVKEVIYFKFCIRLA